ncbi:MAG: PilZ domain-containing protein [Bryobacteraceae bacterium]|nr:PilZ domain-containing protein [Bryobacteraceae bacterium]
MADIAKEHRKTPRKPAASVGLLHVYRLTQWGDRKPVGPSLLIDISGGGIAVQVDYFVDPGVVLLLKNTIFERYAIVRSCRPLDGVFQLGMEYCRTPANDKEAKR